MNHQTVSAGPTSPRLASIAHKSRRSQRARHRCVIGAICQELEPRQLLSTVFTINPNASAVHVTGTLATVALEAQYAFSLNDQFDGTITADLAGSTITFDSAAMTGNSSGSATPGNLPANYAILAPSVPGVGDVNAAIRALELNLTSGALALSGDSVDLSAATVSFISGKLDTSVGNHVLSGALSVPSGTDATVVTNNGTTTLTLTVNYSFMASVESNDDTQLTLSGTIVAVAAPPPPTTVTAVLNSGTLTVTGTAGPDKIKIDTNGSNIEVKSSGALVNTFAASSVTSVVVDANGGADIIRIKDGVGPASVLGQGGADTILAANSADDTLVGGNGADSIRAGTGDDVMIGGNGANTLVGGPGANSISGGSGNDTIIGGDGAETIEGGGGTDAIFTGPNDSLPGGSLTNIDFTAGSPVQSGAGVIASTGNSVSTPDAWTDVDSPNLVLNQPALVEGPISLEGVNDIPTGSTVKVNAQLAEALPNGSPKFSTTAFANLMGAFLIANPTETGLDEPGAAGKITISGLQPDLAYNIWLISSADTEGRITSFNVNGVVQNCLYNNNDTTFVDGDNYLVYSVAANGAGKIRIFFDAPAGMEADLNGIQFEPAV